MQYPIREPFSVVSGRSPSMVVSLGVTKVVLVDLRFAHLLYSYLTEQEWTGVEHVLNGCCCCVDVLLIRTHLRHLPLVELEAAPVWWQVACCFVPVRL